MNVAETLLNLWNQSGFNAFFVCGLISAEQAV